jgi:hypothetical protein
MDTEGIAELYMMVSPFLDERARRLVAASEAKVLGRGGIAAVAARTGVARNTIARGLRELAGSPDAALGRVRRPGGGRKRTVDKDPTLVRDLEALVEPMTRGDPESPLRWTCKSVRTLARELRQMGHQVSHQLVSEILEDLDYSLQANRKVTEGEAQHPDRNAQFEYIHDQVQVFQASLQPVISVDTKKKELVGDFKNAGRQWRPQGYPEPVRVHDFIIDELGRVSPFGVYDMTHNVGWVSVGIDHDTSAFAVASIREWWQTMGEATYPAAERLLITADCGGSNGNRVRLWKTELQRFADETGLSVTVCHLPPGTSKWNKIEHRLFSFITQNWRGEPLVSHEVIVKLIASTSTATGLRVQAKLHTARYPKGVKVTDQELQQVNIGRHDFHGEWNYTIRPQSEADAQFIS